MKIKVSLAMFNHAGFSAEIEGIDERSIHIYQKMGGTSPLQARQACLTAAERLREAAERFELLAAESEPTNRHVHDRINRRKLPGRGGK